MFLEDVEEIVVSHFEDLRGDTHADGVALAYVVVDHDLHRSLLFSGTAMPRQPCSTVQRQAERNPPERGEPRGCYAEVMSDAATKVGSRLRCPTCGTEVIVVKAPTTPISCCGQVLAEREA
jgi:hypothetical protein